MPKVAEHLAGRWAAKEAAIKAAKPRKLTLLDIEVLWSAEKEELYALIRDNTYVHRSGTRGVNLASEENADAAADNASAGPMKAEHDEQNVEHDPPGQIAAISISHDLEYATAVCIAPLTPLPGDVGGEAQARMYDPPGDGARDDNYGNQ